MTASNSSSSQIEVFPATAERWNDLESLFGAKGAYAGCWCMFWRLERGDFKKLKGAGTQAVLHDLVCENEVPGVLAYAEGKAVGWCSIGPRQEYAALENSRILKRIDDTPVWSVVCFFVAKTHRNQGVMEHLLRGAVKYALEQGAQAIDGYPIDLQTEKLAGQTLNSYAGYMGIASVFRAVGFIQVGSASETQLIMRYTAG